jgi:hypothetical protein
VNAPGTLDERSVNAPGTPSTIRRILFVYLILRHIHWGAPADIIDRKLTFPTVNLPRSGMGICAVD